MDRDRILLTPGPLTTSLPTKMAMLRDWGSWDSHFNAVTADVRRRLVDIIGGTDTHVCVSPAATTSSRRSRTLAVIALNVESHEPQSRSIAIRVGSAVVRGPGVSRIGSRLKLLMGFAFRIRA